MPSVRSALYAAFASYWETAADREWQAMANMEPFDRVQYKS